MPSHDPFAGDQRFRSAGLPNVTFPPNNAALRERLAITDDAELAAYIKDLRGLERPIDTDLSFTGE